MTIAEKLFGTVVIVAAVPVMFAYSVLSVLCEAALNLFDIWIGYEHF